jgi:hypothetical protein
MKMETTQTTQTRVEWPEGHVVFQFDDSDDYDLSDLDANAPDGWVEAGNYGWCNDVDWHEGICHRNLIEENCNEPCLGEIEKRLTSAGIPYVIASAVHDDDYRNNRGTSNTCAWWNHSIFVPLVDQTAAENLFND